MIETTSNLDPKQSRQLEYDQRCSYLDQIDIKSLSETSGFTMDHIEALIRAEKTQWLNYVHNGGAKPSLFM